MFGLNPDLWMDGQHCLNGEWIIEMMAVGSSFTTIFYYIFCILSFLLWRVKKSWISHNSLFLSLSVVFFLCGTIHFGHGMGKIIPEFYLTSLLYPFSVVVMIKALYDTYGIFKITKTVVTREKYEILEAKLEQVEQLLDDGISN